MSLPLLICNVYDSFTEAIIQIYPKPPPLP